MPSQHCLPGKCQKESLCHTKEPIHPNMTCPSVPSPGLLAFPLGRASLESLIGLSSCLGMGPGRVCMLSRKKQGWTLPLQGSGLSGVYGGQASPDLSVWQRERISPHSGSELNALKEQLRRGTPSPHPSSSPSRPPRMQWF